MKFTASKARMAGVKRQAGIGMLELVLGFAVVIAFIGIIFVLYGQVLSSSNVAAESTSYSTLVGKMKDYFRGNATGYDPGAGGLTLEDVATDANLAPSSMVAGQGDLRSSWGTDIDMVPITIANANDAFTMTYNDIPATDCAGFVSKIEGSALIIDVAGGTIVKDLPNGVQLDRVGLAGGCDADGGAPVDVIVTIR